jgi:hypothetical protein
VAADTLPDAGATAGKEFAVPPRLAQGASLAFRWLAAHGDIEEMNGLPAANPICGWVVPNHLDNRTTAASPPRPPAHLSPAASSASPRWIAAPNR